MHKLTTPHVAFATLALTVAHLAPTAGAAQLGAQPVRLGDLRPGPVGSSILALTEVNGTLFFTADDGVHGRELWTSDGTKAGTSMVIDLALGPASGVPGVTEGFAVCGGELYFPALGNQLWRSDGTPAGTLMVWDFVVPAAPPRPWVDVGGVLYFAADDGISGRELWKTDGTPFGTMMVEDIRPGRTGSIPATVGRGFAVHWNLLFFVADNGVNGAELWQSDGTLQGTRIATDMNPNGSSYPDWLVADGTSLWWVADVNGTDRELLRIDTTGPWLVDVDKGGSSAPKNLLLWQSDLYFTAFDNDGYEPYRYAAASAKVIKLKDINPGFPSSIVTNQIDPFVPSGGDIFFRADDGAGGSELWKTDGSPGGTVPVRDIEPGSGGSTPQFLTDLSGELVFAAQGAGGREVWRSDGSTAGTLPYFEINPTGAADPDQIAVVGSTVFLVASDGVVGRELWAFDAALSGQSYCTAGTSASGCNALISATGVASAAESTGFFVTVSRLPANRDGILFFNTNGRQLNTWGNGTSYQCVVPPVKRGPLKKSNGTTGCNASFQLDFNAHVTGKPAHAPAVGDLVQIQGWYRDPLNTSNQTTSMSDALEFTFCP